MATEAPAIVLVEDDPNIADLVDLYLRRRLPYQATSGEQGLDYVRTRRPKLAILDLGLPGEIDGIEVPAHPLTARCPSPCSPPATTRSTAPSASSSALTTTSRSRSRLGSWLPG